MMENATRPTVLIVEDHEDSRTMYAEFLGLDFDIREAADGISALDVLRDVVPDVIITDLALPRMDGFELLQRIQGDDRLRDTAVIALSGYSSAEYEERARSLGAVAVLEKPCLPERLAEAVAGAASGRKNH